MLFNYGYQRNQASIFQTCSPLTTSNFTGVPTEAATIKQEQQQQSESESKRESSSNNKCESRSSNIVRAKEQEQQKK